MYCKGPNCFRLGAQQQECLIDSPNCGSCQNDDKKRKEFREVLHHYLLGTIMPFLCNPKAFVHLVDPSLRSSEGFWWLFGLNSLLQIMGYLQTEMVFAWIFQEGCKGGGHL